MIRWLDTLGYRLCWSDSWLAYQWSRIWFHFRCPYPVIPDHSARACVESGECGCNNGPRLAPHIYSPQGSEEANG